MAFRVEISAGSYKWTATPQNDVDATLCIEYSGGKAINHYAILTDNLPREIRRVMGDNGISVPKE
jgi:hypothetical protein